MESTAEPTVFKYVYDEIEARRIDHFLTEKIEGHSRSLIQKWIKDGRLCVNGEAVKSNYKPRFNDEIELVIPPPEPAEPLPQEIPLDILFEDKDIIVLNKQHGLAVHPAPGTPDKTLVNALLYHIKNLSGIGGVLRPGIVHRLDKDTTGVMIVAKNDASHRILAERIKNRSVKRVYHAIIWGVPKENYGVIEAPIGRNPAKNFLWAVNYEKGKSARTYYETIETFRNFSLLRLILETGRTHQIRVHMQHLGHPIVGDPLYIKKVSKELADDLKKHSIKVFTELKSITRQLLHSYELNFNHPISDEPLFFNAPYPGDFNTFLSMLRKYCKY